MEHRRWLKDRSDKSDGGNATATDRRTRGNSRWRKSEVFPRFVSDRLAVPLTDAPVRGCVPELERYTLDVTVSVMLQLRSQGSNACSSKWYRKLARVAPTGDRCAVLAGGRRRDGENDGAVHADHRHIARERRSPRRTASQPCTPLTCTRGRLGPSHTC